MEHPETRVETNATRLADLRVELDRREARGYALRVAAAYLGTVCPRTADYYKAQQLYAATLSGLTMRGMGDIAAEIRGLTTRAIERRATGAPLPYALPVAFRMPPLCS